MKKCQKEWLNSTELDKELIISLEKFELLR